MLGPVNPSTATPTTPAAPRRWSRGEEVANSVSHGLGFLACVAGTPFLLWSALPHPGPRAVLAMSVFAATAMLLYFSSAAHHWLPPGRAKDFFEVLDHAAIFLMIAGSYTPFALGILWGPWGRFLLAVVWSLALAGVLLKTLRGLQPRRFVIPLYVLMGWFIVVAAKPLMAHMPPAGLALLVAGGLAYTGGLVFYLARRFPYHHLAWHISVLCGTALHYFAVLRYAF
jgi:hemolysin III